MIRQTHRAFATTFTTGTLITYNLLCPTINKIIDISPKLNGHQVIPITYLSFVLAIIASWLVASVPDLDMLLKRHNISFIPIAHRGITHTIWVILLLGYITYRTTNIYLNPIMLGITLGWLSHIIADAFSNAGVALLYPIQRYNRYSGGAMVVRGKRGIFQPLYAVGTKVGPFEAKYYYYILTIILICIYLYPTIKTII